MSNSARAISGLVLRLDRRAKVKRNTRKHLRIYETAQRKRLERLRSR